MIGLIDIQRWSYGTVSIVALLAVYSFSTNETFIGAYSIILGTALALAIAHLYSRWLEERVATGRVSGTRWGEMIRNELTFLLVTVPSFIVLLGFKLLDADLSTALSAAETVSLVSLSVVAMVSARRAGLGFWYTLEAGSIGLLMGMLVIALQVGLKPH